MVILFPRDTKVGEPASEKRLNKLQFIKQITTQGEDGEEAEDVPCTVAEFQADIRGRFLEILEEGGITATQFPSIDGDEDFLKVYLAPDGQNIRQMAETLRYSMPYKEEKYRELKANGPYKGHEPEKNDDGNVVVAYGTYTCAKGDDFEEFKFIDTVRVLEQYLARRVSLEAMEMEGVILQYFPCPKAKEMEYLYLEESNLQRCKNWALPNHDNANKIRDYFGEDIAFLYCFYAYLIRSMALLAVGGAIYFLLAVFFSESIKENDGYLRTGFCVLLSIWATMLIQVWGRRQTRICQLWGCDQARIKETDLPEWDPNGGKHTALVNALALLYVAVYAALTEGMLEWTKQEAEEGRDGTIAAFALTLVIKGGGFLWGKMVPRLVRCENLRTEREYQEKLTSLLAGVKIFVALYPLVAQCFLAPYNDVKCYPDVATAMNETWSISPEMVESGHYNSTIHILQDDYMFTRWGAQLPACVKGCYPTLRSSSGALPITLPGQEQETQAYPYVHKFSDTQCQDAAVVNLRTYFAIQIVTELAFLIIGIALTKYEIWKEQKKANKEDSSGEKAGYSLLQYSAKCWKYEYYNWGGSLVEDYLDIAIAYAVVVCFGLITPVMAVIATAAFMLSYRLRIYRALYVAQRPSPCTSTGMGIWHDIFKYINTVAVICNAALSALFFYPSRSWSLWKQLLVFVVIEHAVLILRQAVDFLVPDEPDDVAKIRHYNEYFVKSIESSDMSNAIANTNLSYIDLSLNPENMGDDDDDEDTEDS
eukprot:TRINITY_DN6206_c0_g1_i1.p1 TRINITY_DN6206_c0_g1~~TRINITY_DN6206_c0_g1_i1.p1  ORF type:complete len:860 (-),score=135.36 TRINITY_DN6206_c0_g1_i1:195-2486(-)